MKVITAIAGTALTAALFAATPSQAQFFDPLFAAPAAAANVATGVATGVVGATTGVVGAATDGFFGGTPYNNAYNYNYNYGAPFDFGYNQAAYNGYNYGYGYGYGYPNGGYVNNGYAVPPAAGYATQPAYTGRSVSNVPDTAVPQNVTQRQYRQYRRSPDNRYN